MEDIKNIADISGFGKNAGYEKDCQKMLQTGYEWLEENKDKLSKLKGKTYKHIYGIFEPNSKEARRGSKTGIQGTGGLRQSSGWKKEDRVARSIIPKKLCLEIVDVCERKTKIEQKTLRCDDFVFIKKTF